MDFTYSLLFSFTGKIEMATIDLKQTMRRARFILFRIPKSKGQEVANGVDDYRADEKLREHQLRQSSRNCFYEF